MKEYKVEAFTFPYKPFKKGGQIVDNSKKEIQEKLDLYAQNGWQLVSTDMSYLNTTMFYYLFFERVSEYG